ncbi:MAG: geranylgeranyl reductase family protein [Candidatus Hodarchaeota archaeon]
MTKYFDVIVVGAQTGGSSAGLSLAKNGLKVGLLDSKKYDRIGNKVCGDATAAHHFERAKKEFGIPIEPPHGDEVRQKIEGFDFIAPNRENKLRLQLLGGFIIDRFAFVRRLFQLAEDAGCDVMSSSHVRKPIIENDHVVGVEVRRDGNISTLRAKIVVDASGINAVIRRGLDPKKTFMEQKTEAKDVGYCYREIRDLKHEIDEPGIMRLVFDQELCPRGYYWAFPAGSHKVNAGLGVEVTGSQPSAKQQFVERILKGNKKYSGVDFRESILVHGGGGRVPLRRPIDSLVWNGLCLVGDAGCTVKPTDGGGIGLSVIAAAMASQPITEAIESDNVSIWGPLWNYNVVLMRDIGAVNAPLALIKNMIVQASNAEINEVFKKGVLTADDILAMNDGEGLHKFGMFERLKRLVKGRKVLGFMNRLRSAYKEYQKAEILYKSYPDNFNDFSDWRRKILQLYS